MTRMNLKIKPQTFKAFEEEKEERVKGAVVHEMVLSEVYVWALINRVMTL